MNSNVSHPLTDALLQQRAEFVTIWSPGGPAEQVIDKANKFSKPFSKRDSLAYVMAFLFVPVAIYTGQMRWAWAAASLLACWPAIYWLYVLRIYGLHKAELVPQIIEEAEINLLGKYKKRAGLVKEFWDAMTASDLLKGSSDILSRANYKYDSVASNIIRFRDAPGNIKKVHKIRNLGGIHFEGEILALEKEKFSDNDLWVPEVSALTSAIKTKLGKCLFNQAAEALSWHRWELILLAHDAAIELDSVVPGHRTIQCAVSRFGCLSETKVGDALLKNRVWRHPNVDGSRDRRFNDNPQDYRYDYWHLETHIGSQVIECIYSSLHATELFWDCEKARD